MGEKLSKHLRRWQLLYFLLLGKQLCSINLKQGKVKKMKGLGTGRGRATSKVLQSEEEQSWCRPESQAALGLRGGQELQCRWLVPAGTVTGIPFLPGLGERGAERVSTR